MHLENLKEKSIIIAEYIAETYPEVRPLILRTDTITMVNILYSLALRNNEIFPIYDEYKKVNLELTNYIDEYEQKKLKIESLHKSYRKKTIEMMVFIFIYGILSWFVIRMTFSGFTLWQDRVQDYQDDILKQTALNTPDKPI